MNPSGNDFFNNLYGRTNEIARVDAGSTERRAVFQAQQVQNDQVSQTTILDHIRKTIKSPELRQLIIDAGVFNIEVDMHASETSYKAPKGTLVCTPPYNMTEEGFKLLMQSITTELAPFKVEEKMSFGRYRSLVGCVFSIVDARQNCTLGSNGMATYDQPIHRRQKGNSEYTHTLFAAQEGYLSDAKVNTQKTLDIFKEDFSSTLKDRIAQKLNRSHVLLRISLNEAHVVKQVSDSVDVCPYSFGNQKTRVVLTMSDIADFVKRLSLYMGSPKIHCYYEDDMPWDKCSVTINVDQITRKSKEDTPPAVIDILIPRQGTKPDDVVIYKSDVKEAATAHFKLYV